MSRDYGALVSRNEVARLANLPRGETRVRRVKKTPLGQLEPDLLLGQRERGRRERAENEKLATITRRAAAGEFDVTGTDAAIPLEPVAGTPIRGRILEVDGNLATISVGSADGVQVNMTFVIYRGSDYVGDLRIIDIEPHTAGPEELHFMAAVKNANYYEVVWVHPNVPDFNSPIYKNMNVTRLDCIDEEGMVQVPDGSGLGVEYDWDYISKHSTGRTVCNA